MKFNLPHIKEYISEQSNTTKIYIGVDSERVKINGLWYADYTAAIVVHIDSKHGCKLFGEVTRERDFDKPNRPNTRLMTEVYKASALYLSLVDVVGDREMFVHLDINPNEFHASSNVVAQAIGYIRGTCNVTPSVKPYAWAASTAADRFRSLKIANE